MGTLFAQPPRKYCNVETKHIRYFLEDAKELAAEYEISVADVIAAKDALERERWNDLYAANGDVLDEQLAGFGEILKDINDSLAGLNLVGDE